MIRPNQLVSCLRYRPKIYVSQCAIIKLLRRKHNARRAHNMTTCLWFAGIRSEYGHFRFLIILIHLTVSDYYSAHHRELIWKLVIISVQRLLRFFTTHTCPCCFCLARSLQVPPIDFPLCNHSDDSRYTAFFVYKIDIIVIRYGWFSPSPSPHTPREQKHGGSRFNSSINWTNSHALLWNEFWFFVFSISSRSENLINGVRLEIVSSDAFMTQVTQPSSY